jgi:Cyclic nucleotide-binding domain
MQIEILGHIFNLLYIVALLFKDMLWLRLCLIVAASLEIIYCFYAKDEPLWIFIIWASVWVIINIVQSGSLIRERLNLRFTSDELKIKDNLFSFMKDIDFRKLIDLAHWDAVESGTTMVKQDTIVDRLIIIINGRASLEQDGKTITHLSDYNFAGEISFITGKNAKATIISEDMLIYLYWNKTDLQKLMSKDQNIKTAIHAVFNTDLLSKINKEQYF